MRKLRIVFCCAGREGAWLNGMSLIKKLRQYRTVYDLGRAGRKRSAICRSPLR
ncbi:hypothetical protein Z950_897 [Sulfitobacter mediterraneus KCTC 32188]|nr:hypothetical protein Z950_897 [Sulfitobacter mediterraneus KCTC 32188]